MLDLEGQRRGIGGQNQHWARMQRTRGCGLVMGLEDFQAVVPASIGGLEVAHPALLYAAGFTRLCMVLTPIGKDLFVPSIGASKIWRKTALGRLGCPKDRVNTQ
jgi:hypothetical protein